MKKDKAIFQARVFPSKKNDDQHLLVYGVDMLDDTVKSEDKVVGFEEALESEILQNYLGASEYSKALDCKVITKAIPFTITVDHLPVSRTWTPEGGEPTEVYASVRAHNIISAEDLVT